MEDAYVIGIRLALEDGVSAGIATIAGELAVLDAAIATTSVNLERLQDLARSVEMPRLTTPSISRSDQGSPPASPANDPILAPATPPGAPSLPAPSTEPIRESGTVPAGAAPPPTRPPEPAVAAPPPRPPAPVAASVPSPVIRVFAPSTVPEPPAAAAPRPINDPPERPPTAMPAPGLSRNVANAPTADGLATRPPATFTERDPRPEQPVPPVINVTIAAPVAPNPPVQVERAESHPRTGPRTVADPVAARYPLAPAVPQAPNVTTPRPAASSSYPGASAAPPPRDSLNGPRQGDVYLDGTRLGRWIADRLAGDAGGPQSGVTGFDPRLGATWPGASQGF